MSEKIVFYVPKSMFASVMGVLAKMVFLGVPFLAFYLADGDQFMPVWLGGLLCFVLGVVLMIQSDRWVAPLIGIHTEFEFTETELRIRSAQGRSSWALADLPPVHAFQVTGDTAIKHVEITLPDGQKYDVFETWVTSETSAAFDRVYRRFAPQ